MKHLWLNLQFPGNFIENGSYILQRFNVINIRITDIMISLLYGSGALVFDPVYIARGPCSVSSTVLILLRVKIERTLCRVATLYRIYHTLPCRYNAIL